MEGWEGRPGRRLGRKAGKEGWEGGLGRRAGKEGWEGRLGRKTGKEGWEGGSIGEKCGT